MQLHLGALRNVNSHAKSIHGPDTGFDTMGGTAQLHALARFLDALESESALPKTIVYNSNPVENYAFATITGSFSAEGVPGKVQFERRHVVAVCGHGHRLTLFHVLSPA